jgi:PPM family protein phosphatase
MWNPFQWFAQHPPADHDGKPVWRFSAALLSDTGCVRTHNEDSGCFIAALPRPGAQKGLLGIVADGMGGHQAGEVASRLAVDTVCRVYLEETGEAEQRLQNAFAAANRAVFERAAEDDRLSGMGTTCTALALSNGFAYMAHVGDSRLYLIRKGEIYQMTEDHSHVMELVRKGLITAEQARDHPDRNVLHRALGRQAEVDVSSWAEGMPLQDGDRYLLCSDGLSGVLPNEIILQVATELEPVAACAHLIDLTRRAGAPDNVTVGIVAVHDAGDQDADLPPTRELDAATSENEEYKPVLP